MLRIEAAVNWAEIGEAHPVELPGGAIAAAPRSA
jgi:hypothetical protein